MPSAKLRYIFTMSLPEASHKILERLRKRRGQKPLPKVQVICRALEALDRETRAEGAKGT